ncbi:DUF4230 domain-containing protein [Acinetobacter populi]|uniref:DUF4230 domain-containing protein n=1 Tax=Acinetobacter populi TaxID=1582270 RepID=A0A1Z9YZZ7_9GAMM|nr:DUF4230 domain-containing protein [Acinetobacter populi]OUY07779.1 hypothetical protein CAP51_08620 [Acinetobacter populi]
MSGTSSSLRSRFKWFFLIIIIGLLSAFAAVKWYQKQQPDIQVLTSDGVLQHIQHLNNLETVAFHIDTVVTSTREGSWNRLWQDQQKGLFVASGRVVAGLNLSKLTPENVSVSKDGKAIHIKLPPVEILSSSLDKTEIYDIQTGLFGLMDIDPQLLSLAQTAARRKIIQTACQSGILELANGNAQKQIESLFTLTQAQITVESAPVPKCA